MTRVLYLNRSRLISLFALLLLALGSLGQLLSLWNPEYIRFQPWERYLRSLAMADHQGTLIAGSFLDNPQGVFATFSAVWQHLGYMLNSHMADPLWQTFWGGLWRVVMVGLLYWLLTHRRTTKANWFVAMAVAAVAAFPTDWQNLLYAAGTGQLMGLCAAMLAIACWTSPCSPQARRWVNCSFKWWRGWGWYVLAACCAPAATLAAVAAGVVLVATGLRETSRPKLMRGVVIFMAGVLGVSAACITQGGPAMVDSPMTWLSNFMKLLAHPFADLLWPALVIWLPWLVVAWQALSDNKSAPHRESCRILGRDKLLSLGALALLMIFLAAGQSDTSLTGPWFNPSCLLLALVVNTAALVHLLGAGFTKARRQHAQASSQHDAALHVQSTLMKPTHWLLLGWFILLALGYWQCFTSVEGWSRSARQANRTAAIADNQIHGYLTSGDPLWLTSSAPTNGAQDMTLLRSELDDPQFQAAMPARVRPPLKPDRYMENGFTRIPSFAPNLPFYRHSEMGITQPDVETMPERDSHLGLLYKTQSPQNRYLIQILAQGQSIDLFKLFIKNNQQQTTLIGPGHELPYNEVMLRKITRKPFGRSFVIKTADQFELHLQRPATLKSGVLVFISPEAIGSARYHFEPWRPWSDAIAGLGIVMLLLLAGQHFFKPECQASPVTLSLEDHRVPGQRRLQLFQQWAPMLGTLLVAAVILFIRKSDALLNPQFWAEDGTRFFADQYHHGLSSVFHLYAGYSHLIPRLVAVICGTLFPIVYLPAAFNYAALIITLVVLGQVFSKRLPWSTPQKILLTLAVVMMVQTNGEVYLNITNLHWVMAFMLVLTALKASPDARFGSVKLQWTNDLLTLLLVGLSGPMIILSIPIFAMMAVIRRNRSQLLLGAAACLVAATQIMFLLKSTTAAQNSPSPFGLLESLPLVVSQRVFKEWIIFGFNHDYIPYTLLCGMLVSVWLLVFVIACRHKPLRWPLISILAFHGATLAAGLARSLTSMIYLLLTEVGRYFYQPLLMLTWMMIMLLGSPVKWHRRLAMVALACVVVASLQMDFVLLPWQDLKWREQALAIEPGKTSRILVQPSSMQMYIILNPPTQQEALPEQPPASTTEPH